MSINSADLKDLVYAVAGRTQFRPAIIEKDYFLTIILNSLNERLSDRIVFKGGTLLNKIYLPMNRLSEDLDFSHDGRDGLNPRSKRSMAIEPIREGMGRFLESLGLRSDKPRGEGFCNSSQYLFLAKYPSFVTMKEEIVKIEVSLRHPPCTATVNNVLDHFFRDPFSGEDLLPKGSIRSLSYDETVAEKLRAAITRREAMIRDYYDLKQIASSGFDFLREDFIRLFREKISEEGYKRNFRVRFGRNESEIEKMQRKVETDLMPVIKVGDEFDLDETFHIFNGILGDERYGLSPVGDEGAS